MRKKRDKLSLAVAAFAASMLGTGGSDEQANAATLQWDADGATPGILDGAGTWNLSLTNFYDSATTSNVAWTNLNDVVFGGNGATGTPGLVKITHTANNS